MKREELIAYDKWLTRRKWGTGEIISPEKAADLYLAEHPLPPAGGAEEIIESILESLGDPINIHNHAFEIRPYTVDHKTEWWIFHKEVGSGEPLKQWLGKFAALHAQQIADKMVEEKCIDFANWLDKLQPSDRTSVWSKNGEWKGLFTMDNEQLYKKYLKSREK